MKIKLYKYALALVTLVLFSCEENEQLPAHTVVGDAYATYVELSVSNDEPAAGEAVTVEVKYSNYAADPLKTLVLQASVAGGDVADVTTLDESGATKGELITKSITYNVPASAAGSSISLYVVLTSGKAFPQIENIDLDVAP